jgi:predicted MFS family arabinose efflux permease
VSLAILLVGRACLGLAESLFLTGTMSWGIARVGPARTGLVMSWQGIAMYAALGFGAPLGLAVMDRFGFMGIAACTVALPLIGLAVAFTLPSVAPVPAVRAPFLRVVGLIWRQGVVLALSSAPFAAMATFLTLDYAARGWSGAGFALLGFSAGYIGVRLFLAHLPDKIGGAAVAVASLAVEIAGQLCLWAAPTPLLALVGTTVTGLGFSLMFPAMGVDALRRVSPENRGLAVGGFIAFFDIAIGATAPLAGFLVAPFGLRSVFLAGAAACLCAFVLSLRLRRGEGRG